MKIIMAGEGAIARKHLAGIDPIAGVEVASLAGGVAARRDALERHLAGVDVRPEFAQCSDRALLASAGFLKTVEAGVEVLLRVTESRGCSRLSPARRARYAPSVTNLYHGVATRG